MNKKTGFLYKMNKHLNCLKKNQVNPIIRHPPTSHIYFHPYSLVSVHTPALFFSSWDSSAHLFPPPHAPQSCISRWAWSAWTIRTLRSPPIFMRFIGLPRLIAPSLIIMSHILVGSSPAPWFAFTKCYIFVIRNSWLAGIRLMRMRSYCF